jgi:hypothetical protein
MGDGLWKEKIRKILRKMNDAAHGQFVCALSRVIENDIRKTIEELSNEKAND